MTQTESRPVFICYAHEDETFVLSLANDLRAHSVDVWLDQWSIPKGADWDKSIDVALSSCACLLIVLTPESVASDEVRGELRTALDLNKPIVPVLLRSCEVPRRLRLKEYVDLSSRHFDASGGVERIAAAVHDAIADTKQTIAPKSGSLETLIGKTRRWISARPSTFLALCLPPIFFAALQLFRLPVLAEQRSTLLFVTAGIVCALAFWFGSRGGAVLVAALMGTAFMTKPLLVPFEGYGGGHTFPYTSATAMAYWLPGGIFIAGAVLIALISTGSRLMQDFKRLRPGAIAILIAVVTALASYYYFSRATLYDVYLPFRPQYHSFREHLASVSAAIDGVAHPFPPTRRLDMPLVLDETDKTRNEDPSTTGHLFLYQHLTDLDTYFGDIDHAFDNDLYLNLRDTGNEPVFSESVLSEFADSSDVGSLDRSINAPYLVVVKPLTLGRARRVDAPDLPHAGPYRVFLYQLKRDEIIFVADVEGQINTMDELKDGVNRILEKFVGAKILQ